MLLAGCGAHYDFVIHDNETADLTYVMWDSSGLSLISRESCTQDKLEKSTPLPKGVKANYTFTSHNGQPACQVTAKSVPLNNLQTDIWTIKHQGGKYVFDLSPEALSKLGKDDSLPTSPGTSGGMKISVSVTFPEEVTKSNGRNDDNKVTWDNVLESSEDLHAEGGDGTFHLQWWMIATAVAVVGAITLLLGAVIGSAKDDMKKVLAASTMSQIGYMMLGAGLGPAGYALAIFHLLTHGFFKAQLFLGAGSVMHAMGDQVDMRRFGALAGAMRITWATMGIGWLAILGVPPFSGFWSKDRIIEAAFTGEGARPWILGGVALVGAGLTAFYMSRLFFMIFHGSRRWTTEADPQGPVRPHESGWLMTAPLVILSVFSLGLGGAAASLEGEGTGDHTDGQRADALGQTGDDGGCASAGPASLARGDEDHVRALQGLADVVLVVLGGLAPDGGVGAGAQAPREIPADVELGVSVGHEQRLGVGVDGDEFDATQTGLNHAVDRVDAATADTHHLDDCLVVLGFRHCCLRRSPSPWAPLNP